MGGIGSGRQNQGGKEITSNMKSLDIRKLQRHGLLLPDMDCTWHWIRNGEKVPSLHIYTDADRMIISYQDFTRGGEWRFMEYTVYLEWTDCNLGGRRAWFHCPVQECGQRVAILYSDSILACRRCHKLVYACQRESDSHGSIRGADGIRSRLGWKPGIANPEGDKPKGMHWRTFERLKARHDAFADTSWDWMAHRLEVLERRLSDRGIDLDNLDGDD